MKRHFVFVVVTSVILSGIGSVRAVAQPVAATDLSTISLGGKIVGPVGPEVDSTIAFDDAGTSTGVADLIGSVSCDDRFADCSAAAVVGFDDVVYTYQHQVNPGVDLPNDPPFPAPDVVVAMDDVTEFRLQFPAYGFNGIAGYNFSQASSAIGIALVSIERLGDGSLAWRVPDGSGWDTGEPITFFWQTSQRPTGPAGIYAATNGDLSGVGNGPIPAIPEPAVAISIVVCLLTVAGRRARCRA